jgi:hypothetical protein
MQEVIGSTPIFSTEGVNEQQKAQPVHWLGFLFASFATAKSPQN